ncbi:high affinity immunoglobulin gamma Fc receptor I-like [Amphiprion ocellaris]|uniref:high affinity immunoglobulin gamma Fc receptor I-like n=1 Tax=Amphiprion ocellaris TaxID=80972 RepID=UPI0024114680|nr:high affinity immunoglobulin gamma Fc receptor I-like [Amphiprion ocellaris]
MEVKPVLMLVLVSILLLHVHSVDAVFRIVSNRLQLFQYESVSFHCEGLDNSTQLKGIRNTEGFISVCDVTVTVSCTIHRAYLTDSGEYWCETDGGDRSSSTNITVTAGSVILESPVLPVMEGNNVTLKCRTKEMSSDLTAAFYKDGLLIGSSSAGEMILHSVSGSDEGLYNCNISSVGESPQSWLTVRALHRHICPSSGSNSHVYLILRTVFTIIMVVLLLLLLLVGLIHCHSNSESHRSR